MLGFLRRFAGRIGQGEREGTVSMRVSGLLFDKDGTLLDFEASWPPVIRQAAAVAAHHDEALARALMVMAGFDPESGVTEAGSVLAAGNTAELAEVWAPHAPGAEVGELTETLERIFQEGALLHSQPVCDLRPAFESFARAGLSIGLATSDSEAAAEATVKKFGLRERFHFICGYDSGHGPKPQPGMIHAFCAARGHRPEEVMMIGDNTHDLEMARAAGAIAVGVLSGTGRELDLAPLADYLLGSVADLPSFLGLEQTQEGPNAASGPSA
jgi:phosphoglycolate phosphatase